MNRKRYEKIYTVAVIIAALALSALSAIVWPWTPGVSHPALLAALTVLVAVTGRFPFKVSPQADATLVTVPLFMAVLILHPIEAALVGAVGIFVSEVLLKAPVRVLSFNVGANGVVAASAGIIFWLIRPGELGGFDLAIVLAAGTAGLALTVIDLSLIFGLVTIVKGRGFWQRWNESWAFESILDGSQLAIGFLGAHIIMMGAGWALAILALPVVAAYYAFSRSVSEVVQKTKLAEELDENLHQLKEAQSQLIQSAKLATVGTLAAGIAHDINNPLTVITARGEILLSRIKASGQQVDLDKVSSGIQDMHTMAMRISTIVNQLLNYSRRSEDLLAKVGLTDIMEDALPLLERKIEKKNINLIKEYEYLPTVNVVPNQITQVFMNLVSNAIDAMPDEGTVTLGCMVENGTAIGYVRDDGTGIPPEVLERIFEPFFTTKEVGKGTGLGLFICHKIINDHGGELSVESRMGEGTTFFVKLPVVEVVREEQRELAASGV
jgi:signal transduction histidine kinase